MIEDLKSDVIIRKVGGRYRLTALIQKRWLQLLQGARPLVDSRGLTTMETIVQEILEGKIEPEMVSTGDKPDEES